MDNLQMLNLIVGALSPVLIATITRPGFDARLRVGIMLAVSLVLGFLTSYFSDALTIDDVTKSVLTVIVTAVAAYEGIFKHFPQLKQLEAATSPKVSPEAVEVPESIKTRAQYRAYIKGQK